MGAAPVVDEQRGGLHLAEVLFGQHMVDFGRGGRVHGHDVRALEQFAEPDGFHALVGDEDFADVGVVGYHVYAERPRAEGGGARHVAERHEAERLPHQARELGQQRPPFAPTALTHHAVHDGQTAERRQHEHHRVVGHLFDEDVRHVGYGYAALRGGGDVHGVRAHAAERDYLAVLKAVDDVGRYAPPPWR